MKTTSVSLSIYHIVYEVKKWDKIGQGEEERGLTIFKTNIFKINNTTEISQDY